MGTFLPESIEVQFGWVFQHHFHAGYTPASSGTYSSRSSDAARLLLVDSGQLHIDSDDMHYEINGGSVMLLPPAVSPETRILRGIIDSDTFVIGFRLLLFGNLNITKQLKPFIWTPEPQDFDVLSNMTALLLRRSRASSISADMVRDGILQAIIGLCWEVMGTGDLMEGKHPQIPPWLTMVMQEIRHYPGMSVTDLERLTGYSHTHFHRLFQQYVGVPARVYLQQNRLDVAKHLLMTTQMSVTAIAEHLGFAGIADFTRFFHRMCLISPTEYRQASSPIVTDL